MATEMERILDRAKNAGVLNLNEMGKLTRFLMQENESLQGRIEYWKGLYVDAQINRPKSPWWRKWFDRA